jgi:hypothetical protein
MRRAALALLAGPVVLTACGSAHRAISPAALKLVRRVMQRTVRASSLHFTATYRGFSVGSGDVDNIQQIVRLRSPQGMTVIAADGTHYVSAGQGRWYTFTDGSPGVLPPFLPAYVLRHAAAGGFAQIGPREYRLWTAKPRVSFDVWLAHGYVRRLRLQGTTMNLSRFGVVHLSAPSPSEVRS